MKTVLSLIFTAFSTILLSVNVFAYPVPLDVMHFPDSGFLTKVHGIDDAYGDGDDFLSREEAEQVKRFPAYGVRDLTGIEYFPALERIEDGYCIEDINLNSNNALKYFQGELNLKSLDLSKNRLLEILCLSCYHDTKLETLSGVSNKPFFKTLSLYGANLKELDLSNDTQLTNVEIDNNSLASLNIRNCPSLEALDVSKNDLTTLDVSECSSLKKIRCRENRALTKIDVNQCLNLKSLYCEDSNISSIKLGRNQSIYQLTCQGNPIKTLDISGCPKLIAAYNDTAERVYSETGDCYYSHDPETNALYVLEVPSGCTIITTHNHALVTIKGSAATCTTSGLTDGKRCSICGKIVEKQATIKALGHNWSMWKTTKAATNTCSGTKTRKCLRCGKQETTDVKNTKSLEVITKKVSVKAKTLKKKKVVIKKVKSFVIKNAKGAIAFKKVSGSKKLSINKAGNITVKKKTKKGTYKMKVKVMMAGNKNHKSESKIVVVAVKVK